MDCPRNIIKQADALSRAFQRGTINLKSITKASKGLKLRPRFLKTLGTGVEGTANLMSNPTHGTAVNKIFNPKSPIFHAGLISDKINIMKKMKGRGHPIYYGKGTNNNSILMEYIQGKPGGGGINTIPYGIKPDIKATLAGLKIKGDTFLRTGKVTSDYALNNHSNIIRMANGNYKVIDFIPHTKNLKKTPMAIHTNMLRKSIIKILRDKDHSTISKALHPKKYISRVKTKVMDELLNQMGLGGL